MIGSMAPDQANIFVDDCEGMGPCSYYNQATIPDNNQIHTFVFEFAAMLQELLVWVKELGTTIMGQKAVIVTPFLALLGAVVSKDGAHVSHEINVKLKKWPSCKNSMDVWGFLGMMGIVQRWIRDFTIIMRPLTLLTHKMVPSEFEWTKQAQMAMDKLKALASMAVPIKTIDYMLARDVTMKSQCTDDYGLVSIMVDSSPIGCGWIVSQQLEDAEYPIIFGLLTFNKVESRYLQPKLKLYGVFCALNVEWYWLHGVHFCLILDASYIGRMINNPSLPNATMTRWITYILLFDFEILHRSTTKHWGPDGLSQERQAEEDSNDSSIGSEPHKGIKIISAAKAETQVEQEEHTLPKTMLNWLAGECLPLEVEWMDPIIIEEDDHKSNLLFHVFEGEAIVPDGETLANKPDHQHKTYDHDSPEYWDEILAYLTSLNLPENCKWRAQVVNHANPSSYWRTCFGNGMVISHPFRLCSVKISKWGSVKMHMMNQVIKVMIPHSAKYANPIGGQTCTTSLPSTAKPAMNVRSVQCIEIEFPYNLNICNQFFSGLIWTLWICLKENMGISM
jgi:RNase H-like domain found in reverse transcriptase